MNSIFITVRTCSSRLPKKSILKIKDKYTIEYVIDSVKKSKYADKIILCTTENREDNILCDIAERNGIEYYQGSELNKFKRWVDAAEKFGVDFFVTADGDDLFYDVGLADLIFEQYEKEKADFINGRGLYVDVYGLQTTALSNVLNTIHENVVELEAFELEHYFDTRQIGHQLYYTQTVKNVPDIYEKKNIRMTLDYKEDLDFFKKIIENLNDDFTLKDVMNYIKENKYVVDINYHREKEWKENQQMSIQDKGWRFRGNEREYLEKTLTSGFGAGEDGTMIEKLEKLFAEKHNQKYAIGFNSGTSTLHTALESFGVGNGDEVIVPALTPAMCGYAIWQTGATPVFTDVREDTFLLDPIDIRKKITKKTKAIMVVHIYGLMCDMKSIMAIADEYDLYVLEDCAQCFLAHDDEDRLSGTIGDVGSWSFENSKHLSCGDGGIITTDNRQLAKDMRRFGGVGFRNLTANSGKVRISRDKFQNPDWERHSVMAYNYRIPELCAAVALAQTERMEHFCERRIVVGKGYESVLKNTSTKLLVPQKVPVGYKHSYYTYGAIFTGIDYDIEWQTFRKKYIEFGGDGIYAAWKTLNQEPCFKENSIGWGDVPVAEKLQRHLMQFTTNQQNDSEVRTQMVALEKTISYFGR